MTFNPNQLNAPGIHGSTIPGVQTNTDQLQNLRETIKKLADATLAQEAGYTQANESRWRKAWFVKEATLIAEKLGPDVARNPSQYAQDLLKNELEQRGASLKQAQVSKAEISFLTQATHAWLENLNDHFIPRDNAENIDTRHTIPITEIALNKAYRLKDLAIHHSIRDRLLSFAYSETESACARFSKLNTLENNQTDEEVDALLNEVYNLSKQTNDKGEPVGTSQALSIMLEAYEEQEDFVKMKIDRYVHSEQWMIAKQKASSVHKFLGATLSKDGFISDTALMELLLQPHIEHLNSESIVNLYIQSGELTPENAENYLAQEAEFIETFRELREADQAEQESNEEQHNTQEEEEMDTYRQELHEHESTEETQEQEETFSNNDYRF